MNTAPGTGYFITFEGPEGSGKSFQANRLAESLRANQRQVVLTHEPGGTPLGDEVRRLTLLMSGLDTVPRAEALLMCAARAQLVEMVIRPALLRGDVVICDRYGDSTLAYQGAGRGLDSAELVQIVALASQRLVPRITILLDLPVHVGLTRKAAQGAGTPARPEWNRMESEGLAFHERVRQGYLAMAKAEPSRWAVFDGTGSADRLTAEIHEAIGARLPALSSV